MSDYRRIADLIPGHGEGQLMTQLGPSACSRVPPEAKLQRLPVIVSIPSLVQYDQSVSKALKPGERSQCCRC